MKIKREDFIAAALVISTASMMGATLSACGGDKKPAANPTSAPAKEGAATPPPAAEGGTATPPAPAGE